MADVIDKNLKDQLPSLTQLLLQGLHDTAPSVQTAALRAVACENRVRVAHSSPLAPFASTPRPCFLSTPLHAPLTPTPPSSDRQP